jgi:methionine synthase II (cobalamin-independent)
LGINDQEGRAVWFDEQYREAVLKGMVRKALWQAKELGTYADKVIIFFDEPILSALGTPAYMGISDDNVLTALNEMSEEVQAAGAAVGVHCCGNMDWSLLARSSIDIISFDAFSYGEKVGLYTEALNSFLERGGYLAWGIVPTSDSEIVRQASEEVLERKVGDLITLYTEKGIDRQRLLDQMLFTPACGMGNLSSDDAEKVLALLKAVGNIQ